MTKIFSSV